MTSRPALIVDTGDPTPPYEQLRRQLAHGRQPITWLQDCRLDEVGQLAADLGLAAGTVGRTYRELESAGLVSSRRGGGTRVSATVPALSDAERAQLVHTYAEAFVQRAALLGADQELILSAVARALRLEPAANAAIPR